MDLGYELVPTMILARFTYDERGQRLLKESYSTDGTTLTQRTWYLRDAGGGEQCVLVHDATAALTSEQLTIGGTRGLGVYERIAKRTLYNLTDHLGNVRVVLDHTDEGVTSIAAAHDYYPHGGIMPGRSYTSALLRSLEYQGMERDGETDLVSFELRSMDVRLGRWQAPDPYAQYHSPYLAMGNNPVSRVDPDGGEDEDSRDASRRRAEERWAKYGGSEEDRDPRSGATSDNQELQRHIEEDQAFREWLHPRRRNSYFNTDHGNPYYEGPRPKPRHKKPTLNAHQASQDNTLYQQKKSSEFMSEVDLYSNAYNDLPAEIPSKPFKTEHQKAKDATYSSWRAIVGTVESYIGLRTQTIDNTLRKLSDPIKSAFTKGNPNVLKLEKAALGSLTKFMNFGAKKIPVLGIGLTLLDYSQSNRGTEATIRATTDLVMTGVGVFCPACGLAYFGATLLYDAIK